MVRRFLLIRHATPAEGSDPPLSERGRAEAEVLGRRLALVRIDQAWSSDLRRAAETTGIGMGKRRSPAARFSPLLREVEEPPSVFQADYPERERKLLARLVHNLSAWLALPDFSEVRPEAAYDQTILVVSHAGPLRVLTCLLLDLPVEKHWCFRFDRASMSIVERTEDMGTLTMLNDICHLEP